MRLRAVGLSSSTTRLVLNHPATTAIRRLTIPTLISSSRRQRPSQQRWVSTKYIAKVGQANEEWATKARKIEAGEGQYFWDFLEERGYVKDVAGNRDQLRVLFNVKRVGAYAGVDPTADSLHIGHLVAFMPLFQMYLHGYPAFILLGGATAKVGDPSGRLTTRDQEQSGTYRHNLFKIHFQLKQLWANVQDLGRTYGWSKQWENKFGIDNNGVWWNKQPMFDIIKRLGTDLRIGPLLSRENVKKKLEEGDGLSFSEFVYPVMQAWDWWTLFTRRGVQVQIGGSDQFGNIITGIECFKIFRKNEPNPADVISPGLLSDPVGFTVPLLTSAKGEKLGKTAGNAVWLDPFKLASHDLYAYFLKQSDIKVLELLKLLTFMPTNTINEIYEAHMKDPPKRLAQHKLAHQVVWLCHGKEVANVAQRRHISLHGGNALANTLGVDLDSAERIAESETTSINNRPEMDLKLPRSILNLSVGRVLMAAGFTDSASEGMRLARAGGAYIGGKPGQKPNEAADMPEYQVHWTPVKDWFPEFNENFLLDGKYLYLRKGKHNIRIVELIPDHEYNKLGLTYPGQPGLGELRTLQKALRETSAELEKKKKQGLDIAADVEALEKSGDTRSAARGSKEEGIMFPSTNERANKIRGLHRRTIRTANPERRSEWDEMFESQGPRRPVRKPIAQPWEKRGAVKKW